MVPYHTFPTSLDLPDLAHGADVFLDQRRVCWVRDKCIDGCILCVHGFCVQRVETLENGTEHVLHGVAPH